MEIIDEKKKLIMDALKELDEMGYVIVGAQSYVQSTSGLLCIHPINKGHVANEIIVRLTKRGQSE